MSGMMHKIKEAVAPKSESTTQPTGAAEYGSSSTGANTGYGSQPSKSSEYGSGGASSGMGSHNLGSSEYGATGRTGGTGAGYGNPASQSTAGPHSSNVANKLDPRVDSDLDNSRTMGRDQTYSTGTGMGGGVGGMGSTGATTHTGPHGMAGGSGLHGTHGSSSGPHASNMGNKLDPRVDSDRDHRAAGAGYGAGNTGVGGGTYGSGVGSGTHNAGPHQTAAANKLDPRVDSDRDHRAAYGAGNTGAGAGTGVGSGMGAGAGSFGNPASRNTAGPHSSDTMNKLDPRVDSDLDGSKTMGRDQTFSRS